MSVDSNAVLNSLILHEEKKNKFEAFVKAPTTGVIILLFDAGQLVAGKSPSWPAPRLHKQKKFNWLI